MNPSSTTSSSSTTDLKSAEEGGLSEEDVLLKKLQQESLFFEKRVNQLQERKQIFVYLLRAWFAIFLALQLNGDVIWNWGLVMLPFWLYFVLQYSFAWMFRQWGLQLLSDIETLANNDPTAMEDPLNLTKMNRGQQFMTMGTSSIVFQGVPLLMSLLLVSRLQVSSFSTFLILIPIFLGFFCCCMGVCCTLTLASCVDPDELEKEDLEASVVASSSSSSTAGVSGSGMGEGNGIVTPPYQPPVAEVSSSPLPHPSSSSTSSSSPTVLADSSTAAYGTFASSSSSSAAAAAATSAMGGFESEKHKHSSSDNSNSSSDNSSHNSASNLIDLKDVRADFNDIDD